MRMDGTVCLYPVHELENNVCLLSFRGWIQDMNGETSSCLGEWISFASTLGLQRPWAVSSVVFLCDLSSFLLRTEVKCHTADL